MQAALLSHNALRPVPPVFSLPLCCIRSPTPEDEGAELPCFARIEFLSAFADNRVHAVAGEASQSSGNSPWCCCRGGCSCSVTHSAAQPTGGMIARRDRENVQEEMDANAQEMGCCEPHSEDEGNCTAANPRTEMEDSFFLTGFTGSRHWQDAPMWREGDVRVFGEPCSRGCFPFVFSHNFPSCGQSCLIWKALVAYCPPLSAFC